MSERDTGFLWKAIQEHCIELTDAEGNSDEEYTPQQHAPKPQNNARGYGQVTDVHIKQELGEPELMFAHFTRGEIIDLSDSEVSKIAALALKMPSIMLLPRWRSPDRCKDPAIISNRSLHLLPGASAKAPVPKTTRS